MMTQLPKLEAAQETFSLLDDWEDRYAYLIDLGRKLPHFPDDQKIDANIVRGCTSQVWMLLSKEKGRLSIKATSDAHIVRGLIALIIIIYGDQEIESVNDIDVDCIFSDLGLSDHLSPNRRSGFFAMVEKIKSVSPPS